MEQVMVCPSCGNPASYLVVNGFSTSVCVICAEAHILDAQPDILIRLDRQLWAHYSEVNANFIAVAAAMQKISQNWETIAPRVPTNRVSS